MTGVIVFATEVEFPFEGGDTAGNIFHFQPSPQVTTYTQNIVSGTTAVGDNLQASQTYIGNILLILSSGQSDVEVAQSYDVTIHIIGMLFYSMTFAPLINYIDLCANVACNAQHVCVNGQCVCQLGYTGINCTDVYHCIISTPCHNSGTCTDIQPNEYMCACVPGYTGNTCGSLVNNCNGINCHNGTCINIFPLDYTCNCYSGYTGDHCEFSKSL